MPVMRGPKTSSASVLIVAAAAQRDILRGRRASQRVGPDVMELQEARSVHRRPSLLTNAHCLHRCAMPIV